MRQRLSKAVPDRFLRSEPVDTAETTAMTEPQGTPVPTVTAAEAAVEGDATGTAAQKAAAPSLPPAKRGDSPRGGSLHITATPTGSPVTATGGGGEPVMSPELDVYRAARAGRATSIAPRTTVLVAHHVTNTGALVRLEQVDYSKAMRAYRVCRQDGAPTLSLEDATLRQHSGSGAAAAASSPLSHSLLGNCSSLGTSSTSGIAYPGSSSGGGYPVNGSAPVHGDAQSAMASSCSPAPWRLVFLRLFGAADVMLGVIMVACFLVIVSRVQAAELRRTGHLGWGGSSAFPWLSTLLEGAAAALGAEVRRVPKGLASMSNSALAVSSSPPAAHATPSSAYLPATRVPSLDTSVTCGLLGLSFLLLARRITGAWGRHYVEEVLVMRGVGLQLSSYGIFNTVRERRFIDMRMLRSLVIHDAFFRYQPIFFLSSSVENGAERVVYFADTLPRLAVLRPVLNGIRAVLYGEVEEGLSLAELEERWKSSFGDVAVAAREEDELTVDDSFADDTMSTPDEGLPSEGNEEGESD